MSTHYDEKGKFFTEVISKHPVPAIIQTLSHRIHGTIHVRRGERLIDELQRAGCFIAVTEAVVYNLNGDALYQTAFLTLNSQQIIWIIPEQELDQGGSGAGARP
jgi:hypothetical protein